MSAAAAPRWYTGDDWAGAIEHVRTDPRWDRVRGYTGTDDGEWLVWLAIVDRGASRRVGASVFDLVDHCWRDLFDDGLAPSEAWADFVECGGLEW